jgi:hypothetical protein
VTGVVFVASGALVAAIGLWAGVHDVRLLTSGRPSSARITSIVYTQSAGTGPNHQTQTTATTHLDVDGTDCAIAGVLGSEGASIAVRADQDDASDCIEDSSDALTTPVACIVFGLLFGGAGVWALRRAPRSA